MNIVEKYVQAVNYRNFEDAAKLFTEDGRVQDFSEGKSEKVSGRQKIQAWLEKLEKEATFTFDSDNVEVSSGKAAVDFTYIDGETKHGRWTFMLEDGLIKELRIEKNNK